MAEYRKIYVCPFCGRRTTYKLPEGNYSCTKCRVKFSQPAEKTVKITRKINVCSTSYRTGPAEARAIRKQLKQVHEMCPDYNAKQLSIVCFCGRNVAERFLKGLNQSN